MPKIGVFGPQGSGKTMLAVLISRLVQRSDPRVKIYTNIAAIRQEPGFITISDLSEFPFDRDFPKIFILDEAMFSIDSRTSTTNINQLWSRALAYFRKSLNVLTFYCTHRPSMLDSRFRDQLDYVIMARKNKHHFDYLIIDMLTQLSAPMVVPKQQYVYDMANYDTYDFPLPIEVIGLMNDERFVLKKLEKMKVSAKAAP